MAQFLPTFEGEQPQDAQAVAGDGGSTETGQDSKSKVVYQDDGEEIEEADVDEKLEKDDGGYCFYFIVDRSGSMRRNMDVTRQALKLFLSSLPDGCKFSIISFGSNYQYLRQEHPFEYNDESLKYCRDQIEEFEANFGGTNIYEPL